MGYFKITLQRSSIGLPRNIKRTLLSLGLRKRLSTVYLSISPIIAGKILKVKELVSVEEVDKRLTSIEMKKLRRPDKGWDIIKRMFILDDICCNTKVHLEIYLGTPFI
ncbi:hypothetical protein MERGE_000198 [Pneumocystis wakefieldiae]|uniref:Large ribosomal subunit protein uL30m n=1 Tax=Pneumocystis wakefieldiae TaxID=38082 RepID=A0A899FTP1_9ASCO|nr:hypothetical protein MERGE_000198 [Pneumocystis wakefieldiae]